MCPSMEFLHSAKHNQSVQMYIDNYLTVKPIGVRKTVKLASFWAFFQNYVTSSDGRYSETSKFNSANWDLSIEVQNIITALIEPKLIKEALKRGLFYAFFRNYAAGSVRKNPETSNFNSANRELSIEVQNIITALTEPKLIKEALKRGLFYVFFRDCAAGSVRKNPET